MAGKVLAARNAILAEYGGLPENYHVVQNPIELGRVAREIAIHKKFDFDTETGGLRPWMDPIYCVSIFVGGNGYLINFAHPLLSEISREVFASQLGEFFLDDKYERRGFNVKFDGHFLEEQAGVKCGYFHGDAGAALWLTHEDLMADRGKGRLKPLCERFLGIKGASFDDAFGLHAWITLDPLVASYYAIKDAELHAKLNDYAESLLDDKLMRLYRELEIPLINEYFVFEREGIEADVNFLPTLDIKLTSEIEELRNEMDSLAISAVGSTVSSWGSDDEVATLLFDKLDLPRIKANSTDKAVLDKLKHPLIPLLQRYRKQTKLKSAFVDALPQFIHNGRVHPMFKVTGSVTGRASCSDPNMLQIPAKGEGAVIRQTFSGGDDYFIVSKDYSGQELCIQAFLSGDRTLKELIRNGGDFYSEVAALYYGGLATDYTKYGENKKKRDKAKIAVLAMSYGAQAPKVAEVFGCDFNRGRQFIQDFYRKFPGLKTWSDKLIKSAKELGYVETILGRRRHLDFTAPGLERWQISSMERQAVNSPVQGSACDQIKLAHLLISRHFRKREYKSRVLFSIHDELVLKINKDEYFNTLILQEVDLIMQNAIVMDIPLSISTETYTSWGKTVKFDVDDAA